MSRREQGAAQRGAGVHVSMTISTRWPITLEPARTATADAETPFHLELAQADRPRGLGVEGYVQNGVQWRITSVLLRVDSVDASTTVTASALGSVLGDVKAGSRGYVPVSSAANTYRATVQSFDKVAVEAPPGRGTLSEQARPAHVP